jgi:hypothetical protein
LGGTLKLHGNATLFLNDVLSSPVQPAQDYAGENSGGNPPTWKLNATTTYTIAPLAISLTVRGFSSGVNRANYIQCTSACPPSTALHPTVNDNSLPGEMYVDASFQYDFPLGSDTGATAFFNVRNIADISAPQVASANIYSVDTNAALYDILGRVFLGGIRFRM